MPRKKKAQETAAPALEAAVNPVPPKEQAPAKEAATSYVVLKPFRDKYDFTTFYAVGGTVTGWEAKRLRSAIERGLIKQSE